MKSIVSAFMVTVILFGTLFMAFDVRPVKAYTTITIQANGSISPPTAPISTIDYVTYTLTGNVPLPSDADGIVVHRDNIVIDGAGHTVQGTIGAGETRGIDLSGCTNVTVRNTQIRDFSYCVLLESIYCCISGNNISTGGIGIYLLQYCSFNCIRDNNINATYVGIGIEIGLSSNNTVTGNSITGYGSGYIGIALSGYASNNSVTGNSITNRFNLGIVLEAYSNQNNVSGNNITNNDVGIWLYYSSCYNSISDNNILDNYYEGLRATNSSLDNVIFHNNFINNAQQTYSSGSTNVWDNGYPSGGNYWSNYTGVDDKSGPGQDQPGSDGLGDTPYIIGSSEDMDSYPLMGSIGPSTTTGANVTVFPADDVCLIFESVAEEGLTTVEKPGSGPAPPPGLAVEQYYIIETTADYGGDISIKIVYNMFLGTLGDGTLQEGWQLLQCVMLAGDVDEDFDVDIFDIVRLAGHYLAVKPDPRYDPQCDIDGDGDIDIFDVVKAAGNYGKAWDPATGWSDITTRVDEDNNSIFGVTQSLSIFGVTIHA